MAAIEKYQDSDAGAQACVDEVVKATKNITSCGKVGVHVGDHGDVARNGETRKLKQHVLRDSAVGRVGCIAPPAGNARLTLPN